MPRLKYVLILLTSAALAKALKVNMQGSVKVGKEVIDAVGIFLRSGNPNRRSMNAEEEYPRKEVKSVTLCAELKICTGKLSTFVEDYVTAIGSAIEDSFSKLHINTKSKKNRKLFEESLMATLIEIRIILDDTDKKMDDENKETFWYGLLKQINSVFLTKVKTFLNYQHSVRSKQLDETQRKNLLREIVIKFAKIESEYEVILCRKHDICMISYDVTKALNKLLIKINVLEDGKLKIFVKEFTNNLLNTTLYSKFDNSTQKELLNVLTDMFESTARLSREIFHSIHMPIDQRLKTLEGVADGVSKSPDFQLLNIILSDMDYLYSSAVEPFKDFIEHFENWSSLDVPLDGYIKEIMSNITKELMLKPEFMREKLMQEVGKFLEITVDII